MRKPCVSGAIYLVVFVVAAVFYVEASVRTARDTVRWQQALATVRSRGEPPQARALQRGWLALVAVFLCGACSLVSLPLVGAGISLGEGVVRLDEIGELYEQGQVDQAVEELETLAEENPDVALIRSALGMSYGVQGQFDKAAEELEIAVELQPEWGVRHATLASVYYFMDKTDLAEAHGRAMKKRKPPAKRPGACELWCCYCQASHRYSLPRVVLWVDAILTLTSVRGYLLLRWGRDFDKAQSKGSGSSRARIHDRPLAPPHSTSPFSRFRPSPGFSVCYDKRVSRGATVLVSQAGPRAGRFVPCGFACGRSSGVGPGLRVSQ